MTQANIANPDRRDFLKASGAGLTFALTLAADPLRLAGEALAADGALSPNVWLSIAADGTISIVSPAAEMGQGSFTTLPLIIAEDLGPAHELWRDRRLRAGAGGAAKDRGQGPQGRGELSPHRQGCAACRGADQGHRCRQIRDRRAGPRHGLRRGAAIALSRRQAGR